MLLGSEAPEASEPLGSYRNTHRIQASFNSPPHPKNINPRPHINIKINNYTFTKLECFFPSLNKTRNSLSCYAATINYESN